MPQMVKANKKNNRIWKQFHLLQIYIYMIYLLVGPEKLVLMTLNVVSKEVKRAGFDSH